MRVDARFVNWGVKNLSHALCRIEDSQLSQVPAKGPLIIVCNHVNFLDVPVVYTHLLPRQLTGYAKVETWDSPVMAYLFDVWQAIPMHRGEADVSAIRRGLEALEKGWILAIAPEGTRSGHGCLGQGHPGVVLLALQSGAPLLPVVYFGHENYKHDFKNLKRASFNIAVGRPFRMVAGNTKITRQVRYQMTDEIMFQISRLLPPPYRGHYADLSKSTQNFLQFQP